MNERDFFGLLTELVARIHDGHTGCYPSSGLSKYMAEEAKVFPLKLRYSAGRPYIVAGPAGETKPGAEVLSLNGQPMEGITRAIMAHLSADGYIKSGKYRALSERFGRLYYLFIGRPQSFEVEWRLGPEAKPVRTNVPP